MLIIYIGASSPIAMTQNPSQTCSQLVPNRKKTRPNRRRSPMGASLCRLRPSLKSCRDRSTPIIFPCECEVLNVDFYKSSMVQPECHRFDPNPPTSVAGSDPKMIFMDVWYHWVALNPLVNHHVPYHPYHPIAGSICLSL